jgi:manganese/iron transport system permease protein
LNDLVGYLVDPLVRYGFMRAGLVAAVVVGVVCAVVSCLLIVRRQALLGDAISHAVLLGVVLGYIVAQEAGVLWGAMLVGILSGAAIAFVERRTLLRTDAAMGVVFTASFALGLAIISVARPRGIDLFHVLFGNVLGVSGADLALTAVSGGLVLAVLVVFFRAFQLWSLDPIMAKALGMPVALIEYVFIALLAAAVVASLQTVGVILVIAMLITPGATAALLTRRLSTMMMAAAAVGVIAATGGLYASFYLDVASGPAMVLVASLLFAVAFLLAPGRGLVPQSVTRRVASARAVDEDLLKILVAAPGGPPDVETLAERVDVPPHRVRTRLRRLMRRGLLDPGTERLTAIGRDEAIRLVRTHRLWEQYLHDAEGVPIEAVHALADELEHGTDTAMLRDLDRILDSPSVDPHGHPIPQSEAELSAGSGRALANYEPGARVIVTMVADDRADLLDRIIDLGIVPGRALVLAGHTSSSGFRVQLNDAEHELPTELVERIFAVPVGSTRTGPRCD